MKSLYEKSTLDEIQNRIHQLTPASQSKWGKMQVDQMLAHCSETMKVVTGQMNIKRGLLGYVLGPIFKPQYYNDKPLPKNSPTAPEFLVTDRKIFETEKEHLLKLVKQFQEGGQAGCTKEPHAFFGKLTSEQWGKGTYKHLDHHLQQFGV